MPFAKWLKTLLPFRMVAMDEFRMDYAIAGGLFAFGTFFKLMFACSRPWSDRDVLCATGSSMCFGMALYYALKA